MEQELTFAILPVLGAIGAIGAGIVGSAVAGKGDKKKGEAAQAAALEQERKRQATLESRFSAQQPLREESLKQLLDFGSKENPFSRRLSDERAAGIIGQIQSLQQQAGQKSGDDRWAQTLESIGANPRERDKFLRNIELAEKFGKYGEEVGGIRGKMVGGLQEGAVRQAGDVLRHFGFDIGEEGVKQLIQSGNAGQIFDPATGIEALRSLGVTLQGSNSNTPVF